MDNNIIIKTDSLFKQYGEGETKVMALDNVSLEVGRGEFVAVTGESGSGKTTLLNVIGSLDKPTSGKVFFNGDEITRKSDNELSTYRRRSIGFIFQSYNLIPVLNVEENIVLPLNLDSTEPDMAYLEELLELTGLKSKRRNYPSELSGGQQQRVAFARALIHKPELILADEPTGNLDSKNSREMIEILKSSIKKYAQTLILITHDLSIAAQADRIFRMQDGVLTESEGTLR
ncbi:putative ABC transport system ATP-binding protein [Ruminococcus sp. YRD2003]|uniref:ABC transporter ATP-binding protein n=1 Tax=Ruminococcus sp. YRD2003 TaxID=1452313 RepID=UPI0008C901D5|nr:ABC transporter ATP-binding protein [Ruminococcus sp.]SEK83271.1 putative ABC transport system ATP-binding protein [Ruminococcus flavefaciens]